MPAPRILVVDDNEDLRSTLAEVLEISGYEVLLAEDGRAALEMAAADPPELMLLDLMMPVMSGWEVIDALRADPELARIPVVVISAALTDPPRGLPFLRKPAPVDEVLGAVRQGLSGEQASSGCASA